MHQRNDRFYSILDNLTPEDNKVVIEHIRVLIAEAKEKGRWEIAEAIRAVNTKEYA